MTASGGATPRGAPTTASDEADSLVDEIAKLRSSDYDLERESQGSGAVEESSTAPGGKVDYASNNGATRDGKSPTPYHFVALRIDGRTHVASNESAALLEEIGGLPALQDMTDRFYAKAFQDDTLDKFLRDRNDPHGRRFATWIHQKLGGPGNTWDEDRARRSHRPVAVGGGHRVVVSDRSSAHVAAWHSPKRPAREVGRHFKLDECRVWMRLHFWAMREAGLAEASPSFVDYYVRFLGHFVNVYEGSAPAFARDSYRWSAKPANTEGYISSGRKMTDVLGISLGQALRQIPKSEAEDTVWPYIESSNEGNAVVAG